MFSGVIFVTMNKPSSVMAQKKPGFPQCALDTFHSLRAGRFVSALIEN